MPSTIAEAGSAHAASAAQIVDQHIVEIVSDSGEGAQTCGQMFADLCARNGNGIWTVEIIPAEIEPPSRSRAARSRSRVRARPRSTIASKSGSPAWRPSTQAYSAGIALRALIPNPSMPPRGSTPTMPGGSYVRSRLRSRGGPEWRRPGRLPRIPAATPSRGGCS